MNNIINTDLFKSRTVWSVILLALFNGVDSVKAQVPANWQPYITPLLLLANVYFHTNPKVKFGEGS